MVINIAYDYPSSQTEKCELNAYFYLFILFINIQAINNITNDSEFKDLHKFQLDDSDWDLLEDYVKILEVGFLLIVWYNFWIIL